LAGSREEIAEVLRRGFRYALSLTHDTADAEDVLQDACLSVLRSGAAFDRPYLFAAIRSRFIDRERRARRAMVAAVDPADRAPPRGMGEALGDAERFHAERDALRRALGRLRAAEREALFLAAVEGYTAAEIATLTGRPRGTVLSLVHRARRKLRRMLTDERERAKA